MSGWKLEKFKKDFVKSDFFQNIIFRFFFFGIEGLNVLKLLLKKDKFWDFKKSLLTKPFVNFSNFQPDKLAFAIYQLIPDNFTSHYHEYIGDLHLMLVALCKIQTFAKKWTPLIYISII